MQDWRDSGTIQPSAPPEPNSSNLSLMAAFMETTFTLGCPSVRMATLLVKAVLAAVLQALCVDMGCAQVRRIIYDHTGLGLGTVWNLMALLPGHSLSHPFNTVLKSSRLIYVPSPELPAEYQYSVVIRQLDSGTLP